MDFSQVCDQTFDFCCTHFKDLVEIQINSNKLENMKEIKDRNKKT